MSKTNKRKRRSFYEPESEVLRAWLDKQSDLGLSLQVVITEIMQKYGDGDVLQAYFRERGKELAEQAGMKKKQVPNSNPIPEPQPSMKQERFIQQQPVQTEVRSETAYREPEAHKQQEVLPSVTETTSEEKQVQQKPIQQQVQAPVQTSHVQDNMNQQQESEEDYDPIKVLLADADSRFQE